MNCYWEEYIDGIESFTYNIMIPVSSEDFKKKILDFDLAFLSIGDRTGFFKFSQSDMIFNYINCRKKMFFNQNRQWVELLDLEQFEGSSIKNMNLLIPNEIGELEVISYHRPFVNVRFLQLNRGNFFHLSEVLDLPYWYENLSVSVGSNSTIWWEDIETALDDNGYPIDLNPPLNNRFFSYRVTPRFNSFLRDLTMVVEKLEGTIELDGGNKRFVTHKGILLDGKIIYQEDIDEGRIQIPKL